MLLMIFFYNNFNFVSGISIDFWKEGWIKNFVIAVNPFIKLYLYVLFKACKCFTIDIRNQIIFSKYVLKNFQNLQTCDTS